MDGMKFFIADYHFNHQTILKHVGRPFKNVHEMNMFMINEHNKIVNKGDLTYIVGDFAFPNKGDGHEVSELLDMMNGCKHLILGNHDKKNFAKFKKIYETNFNKISDTDYIKLYNGQKVFLSHYAHRTWRASCHGSWHLFGHSHGALESYGKSFDVGVDRWNRPLSEYAVEAIMEELPDNLDLGLHPEVPKMEINNGRIL